MPDFYGAAQLNPVPVPAGTFPPVQAIGDPLVGYVGDYLKTVLNAYATAAWQSVQPGKPVVRQVFVHDPAQEVFKEQALPSLFVYREGALGGESQWWEADDYRFMRSRLVVLWIMNPVPQDTKKNRFQIINSLWKLIDNAIERTRDPNWIVPGDPEARSATDGSRLDVWAGWSVLGLEHAARVPFTEAMAGSETREYDALKMVFTVEELLQRDITVYAPNAQASVQLTVPDDGTGSQLGPFNVGNQIYT